MDAPGGNAMSQVCEAREPAERTRPPGRQGKRA